MASTSYMVSKSCNGQDEFEYVARNICNKKNGFVTFNVSEQLLKNIIYDVSMYDLEEPPHNKMRKIIFKDTCQLTPSEKLHIVGSIMGRTKTVTQDDIYDAMLALNEIHDVITVDKLAKYFDCSVRTIYRNMGNCLLYTSPSPRDRTRSRMPSSA